VLKQVFEIANFMVTIPIHYVRLVEPMEGKECMVSEAIHVTRKNELLDTYAAVKYVQLEEFKKGRFLLTWLRR
jgi:hypothetical protein